MYLTLSSTSNIVTALFNWTPYAFYHNIKVASDLYCSFTQVAKPDIKHNKCPPPILSQFYCLWLYKVLVWFCTQLSILSILEWWFKDELCFTISTHYTTAKPSYVRSRSLKKTPITSIKSQKVLWRILVRSEYSSVTKATFVLDILFWPLSDL